MVPRADIKKLQSYWAEQQNKNLLFTGISLLFVHPGPNGIKWLNENWPNATTSSPEYLTNGVSFQVITIDKHYSIPISEMQ